MAICQQESGLHNSYTPQTHSDVFIANFMAIYTNNYSQKQNFWSFVNCKLTKIKKNNNGKILRTDHANKTGYIEASGVSD